MQPTYLGWLGWFDLLDSVDHLVLLDNVQLNYRSWQHRNRIRARTDLHMLTVPVRKGDRRAPMASVHIGDDAAFPGSHINALAEAYDGMPGWAAVQAVIDVLGEGSPGDRLLDLTIPIIDILAAALEISTPRTLASTLDVEGSRSELLIKCVLGVDGGTYVSPPGAVDYLSDDRDLFHDANIPIAIKSYDHPEYPQRFEPFIPFASALDTIACLGDAARQCMLRGRRPESDLDHFESSDDDAARGAV